MTRRVAWVASADATDLDTDGVPLAEAAARAGVETEVAVWDDPSVDWARFDLVVVRATWDYFGRPDDFLGWARDTAAVTTLANDLAVLEWNLDKRYLAELADAGVPVVPTTFVTEAGGPVDLDPAPAWVVKPTVSAGSNDTSRSSDPEVVRAEADRLAADGRVAMIQPYFETVDTDGERGFVCFDGSTAHVFRKAALLPSEGSATIDGLFAPEEITLTEPRADEVDLAERVLAWIAERFGPQLYARVDLIDDAEGRPHLLELELIEPGFFLDVAPASADRFLAAVAARLDR